LWGQIADFNKPLIFGKLGYLWTLKI
jgi:hypothetical protein